MVAGNLNVTITTANTNANTFVLKYPTHIPKERLLCGIRKGGPRSTIFCEVYAAVDHLQHYGRSKTGRWHRWDVDTDRFIV